MSLNVKILSYMAVKIKVLSDHLINQIAAGEVVEDAASVVKELVENALDAGATRIVVSLEKGGYQFLSVVDDGCGMSPDDAVLCFERHATSKIKQAGDLVKLSTLGFRGEALAALAAVSKVTLTTAMEDVNSCGTQVEIAAGRLLRVIPCGRVSGTTIEIRELFYNVPARRKFQASSAVSDRAILRLISAFALGYPGIEFLLQNDGEMKFHARPNLEKGLQAKKNRVREILGEELFVLEQPLHAEENGYLIEGFLGASHLHRAQRSGQYLFVEGRYVFSSLVSRIVRDAFSTRLPEGRHPLFVLYLQFPPGDVDVNVHPQKKEVRFANEIFLSRFIQEAIQKSFLNTEYIGLPQSFFSPLSTSLYTSSNPILPWELQENTSEDLDTGIEKNVREIGLAPEPLCPQLELPCSFPTLATVGLFDKYLMIHGETLPVSCPLFLRKKRPCLVIIDLALASMRITFEEIMQQQGAKLEGQQLLIPQKIHLVKTEAVRLQKKLADLAQIGLEIQILGERDFLVMSMPSCFAEGDIEEILMASLDEIEQDNLARDFYQRFALRACGFVRWNKENASVVDAEALVARLLLTKEPYFSPRGKPIMALLDGRDLEGLF